jgi:hypothetical protein
MRSFPRSTVSRTARPGTLPRMILGSWGTSQIDWGSSLMMTSFGFTPAASTGPPSIASITRIPVPASTAPDITCPFADQGPDAVKTT